MPEKKRKFLQTRQDYLDRRFRPSHLTRTPDKTSPENHCSQIAKHPVDRASRRLGPRCRSARKASRSLANTIPASANSSCSCLFPRFPQQSSPLRPESVGSCCMLAPLSIHTPPYPTSYWCKNRSTSSREFCPSPMPVWLPRLWNSS